MRREARQEIVAFGLLFIAAFLIVSLFTAHPQDVLQNGLWHSEARNACGPLGEMFAFEIHTWLGRSASYGIVLVVGLCGLALLFRRKICEPVWKVVGAALFLLAIATFEVAVTGPESEPGTLPGGFYGQFCYGFLFSHLERFGAYLMVFFALLVALLVSTDALVYPALSRAGQLVLTTGRWRGSFAAAGRAILSVRPPGMGRAAAGLRSLFQWRRTAPVPVPPTVRSRPPRQPEARSPDREPAAEPAEARPRVEKTRVAKPAPGADAAEDPDPDPDAEDGAPAAAAGDDLPPDEPAAEASERKEEPPPRPPLKINVPEPPPRSIPAARQAHRKLGNYKLPALDLLSAPEVMVNPLDRSILEETARIIELTLRNFKIEAQVVEVQKGPVITQYEVSLAAGIKVHKIMALSDDLAMALKAPSIRIVAPIPGKSTVGVEVPNRHRSMVGLRELLECREFREGEFKIPLLLGKDTAGKPIVGDLGEMPHLLIAGSTGSGKSVCINAVIINILMCRTPEEVKLILVDPKMVELSSFEEIPHLLTPVVTDMKKAPAVLNWLVEKMEERYELLALVGVRNITSYNALGREKLEAILRSRGEVEEEAIPEIPDLLPHYVMVIDELADLMMTASKEVESSITRLSQKSRAVGIHIILATQRPSVDVITGLIKANMPSRISFHVASKVDSRTILDRNGADKLLGKGDLLYLAPGTSNLVRAQGTYISDREIRAVVKFVQSEAEPQFNAELSRFGAAGSIEGSEEDELYEQAVRIILDSQRGSVTLLQRQLQIGYTRASRLMEIMHENGLVGPFKGSKAREVYYKLEDWEAARKKAAAAGKAEEEDTDGETDEKS
jgi:S-DNA-T family DNA segregation ATPase FtsK/SpoIIIE